MPLESCFWGDVYVFSVYSCVKDQIALLNFLGIVNLLAAKQFSCRWKHSLSGFRNCLFLLPEMKLEGALASQPGVACTHHTALSWKFFFCTFHASPSLTCVGSSSLCTAISLGNMMRSGGQVHSQANSLLPAAYPSGNRLQIWPWKNYTWAQVLRLQGSLGIWSRVLLNLCLGFYFSSVQPYIHLAECSFGLGTLSSNYFLMRMHFPLFQGLAPPTIQTT